MKFSLAAIMLGLVLYGLWLLLSGHFEPPLIHFGIAATALALGLAARLGMIEPDPTARVSAIGAIGYGLWLAGQIAKANWLVMKAILGVDSRIEPAIVKITTRCRSARARTIFANSITLTPGTVTLAVDGERLTIHALLAPLADADAFAEMDRRVARAYDREPRS